MDNSKLYEKFKVMQSTLSKQELLVKDATNYFKRGDYSLGYRMLLDASLNTNSSEVFKKTLSFVELYENEENKSILENEFDFCAKIIRSTNVPETNLLGKSILKGEGLEKGYKKGNFKLGPVDIELNRGDIYGLVGENGNGKTTLLTILSSLTRKTSGKLEYFFSSSISDDYDLRTKLVYIPQRTPTWYGSVIDNLKFALVHHGVKDEKNDLLMYMMIARFGLWKYKNLKWKELSSGFKMRFELARTMLRKPEIVFLDEPLANLDILAQQVILEDLKMIAKSHVNPLAMIFSSQQLYEVEKVSDAVIYLRNGKPSDLLSLEEKEKNSLIIELDSKNTREDIEGVFDRESLEKIEFNGGVYILYFKEETSFNQVLSMIASNDLSIQYIRDISNSSRRFFVY